jgi:hypothetical protein
MGVGYLWDTNTVIYYLQDQFDSKADAFIESTNQRFIPAISVITEIELLSWKTASKSDFKVLKGFISDTLVFELDNSIKETTAEIRKKTGIKLPDAIIAATALVHDLTILTSNIKDFKKVTGLKLINPHDL